MRKLLLACLFAFLSPALHAQSPGVHLSGTITDVTNTPIAGTVTVTLGNYGPNPPVITGHNEIVPSSVTTTANGSGVWSISFFGEDQINPINTTETITITAPATNAVLWTGQYVIKSGTYDLSNLTPIGATIPPQYIPANGSGSSIIGCSTTGGLIYQNATVNTGTCGAGLTYAAASPNQQFGVTCTPQSVDMSEECGLSAISGTVTGPSTFGDLYSWENNIFITVNSPNTTSTKYLGSLNGFDGEGSGTFTDTGIGQVGIFGDATYGNVTPSAATGTVALMIGVEGQAENDSTSGTVTTEIDVFASGAAAGAGTVGTSYGFKSTDHSNIGATNYDYFAPPATAGSHPAAQYAAAEGVAATGIAGIDFLYADSTNHQWEMINNGGSPVAITGVVTPMTPNVLPKGVGPTTLVNSSIVDNGSTVTTTEPLVAPAATAGSGASSAGAGASGGFACNETSGTGWTATAGQDYIRCDSGTHSLVESANGAVEHHLPQLIASGTAAMTTAGITAGNCGVTVTVSATGVATTDTIAWSFNAAPAGSNAGIVSWPTTNNVNFAYCSNTAQTPAAATINWKVTR